MNVGKQKSILVIEGDDTLAELRRIPDFGWKVVKAASRDDLIGIAAGDSDIDLVFLDMKGDGSGPAIARGILEKRDLPFVFLASAEDSESASTAADLPRVWFAMKGSEPRVLRFTLETASELFEARKKRPESVCHAGRPGTATPEYGSDRERIESALRESEEMFRSITEYSADFIALTDDEGVITYASPSSRSVFGYEPEEMIGRCFIEFLDETLVQPALEAFGESMRSDKKVIGLPLSMRRKDGSPMIGEVNGQRFVSESREGTLVVIRDITERIRSEERIMSLLAEKELLLKEVNHRIKNNMVTIKSLLSLHAGNLKDPEAADALQDAAGRVRSIMVLYEILYQSADFDKLSVREYLTPLVDAIMSSFPYGKRVKVETFMDDFALDTSRLQSIGIVVNELLTNCMKYAFKGRDSGSITILVSLRDQDVVLEIEDDGVGIPENVDFRNSTGFGLALVRMLAENIQGTVNLFRGKGTRIRLEFKL